jgi:hypothetical protein
MTLRKLAMIMSKMKTMSMLLNERGTALKKSMSSGGGSEQPGWND